MHNRPASGMRGRLHPSTPSTFPHRIVHSASSSSHSTRLDWSLSVPSNFPSRFPSLRSPGEASVADSFPRRFLTGHSQCSLANQRSRYASAKSVRGLLYGRSSILPFPLITTVFLGPDFDHFGTSHSSGKITRVQCPASRLKRRLLPCRSTGPQDAKKRGGKGDWILATTTRPPATSSSTFFAFRLAQD